MSPALYAAGDTYAERVELENSRIALIHLAPVILEDDFLGTVSILRDITHEVEVDRLKSEFVATVSHELRTPMTAIKGYVEMLIMGAVGAVNENQAHFLEIVRNNIDRLNSLVGDLLDVSRIEFGKVTLAPEPLDMRQLTEEVLADMRQKAEQDKKPMSFSLQGRQGIAEGPGRPRAGAPDPAHPARQRLPLHARERRQSWWQFASVPRHSQIQVDVTDNGIGIS